MNPYRTTRSRKMLGRRVFLRLAGIGGGAAFLAACGPAATPAPGGATAAPTAAAGGAKTTINFWTPGGSDVYCSNFNVIGQNFEKVEAGIEVADVQCYSGPDSYNEVLLANVAAGNPPDGTVVWDSPVSLAAIGALESLDDLMAASKYSQVESWPPAVLASCQFKGKTYGLPAAASSYGIFYNQELLESKGIPSGRADFPKTWDELRQLSKEFVRWNGDVLESAGFMPWDAPVEIAIWSALNGGMLYDADNLKFTLDSEQNIEMMAYVLDWLEEQYKGDWVKVQASANWLAYPDDQARPSAFLDGKLAAVTEGFWYTGDIYAGGLKFDRWEAAPFPVGPSGSKSVSGYWPNWLVIPKGAKNVEAGFKYLDYISGEGIKVWFAAVPDQPANRNVPGDLVPAKVVEERGQEYAQDVTNFFHGQLEAATPMWTSPVQSFANDQIERAADQILSKQATPKDALAEAQKLCQAELDKVLAR